MKGENYLYFQDDAAEANATNECIMIPASKVLGMSLGASYYRGFSDIVYADDIGITIGHPNNADASALDENMKMFNLAENDDVDSLISFIDNNTFGIKDKLGDATVTTNILLKNPRIDMLGVDMSTSLESLGGLGVPWWTSWGGLGTLWAPRWQGRKIDEKAGSFPTVLGPPRAPRGHSVRYFLKK